MASLAAHPVTVVSEASTLPILLLVRQREEIKDLRIILKFQK